MRIQEAMMKLLLSQPFYGSLATVISLRESGKVKKMEMALFPSPILTYNREWFEALPDAHAIGALLHELLHLLLLHSLRRDGRDPLLWAVCCDMAVNNHLLSEMLPQEAVTTDKMSEKIKYKLPPLKSAEFYYDKLFNLLDDSVSLLQRDNTVVLPFSEGNMLECEMQNEEDSTEMNEQSLKIQLQELVDKSSRAGDLSPELSGELYTVYRRAKVDWRAMFKRFLNNRGRIDRRATYRRESRRYDGYPGSKRSLGLDVLVALDESGSISNDQLSAFLNELTQFSRSTSAKILVTEFDTECSKPQPAQVYRHIKKRVKKGGTDFRPVFALADSLHISFVVVFTDGQGSAPVKVNQRVLWVLTSGGVKPAEYGDSVTFEE